MASTRVVSETTPGPQVMPAFTSCWHLQPCPVPWHLSELREILSFFLAPVHRGNYMLAPTTHSCRRCHTVTIHRHARHTMPCEGSVTEPVPTGSLWAPSLPLAPLSPQFMPTVWTTWIKTPSPTPRHDYLMFYICPPPLNCGLCGDRGHVWRSPGSICSI